MEKSRDFSSGLKGSRFENVVLASTFGHLLLLSPFFFLFFFPSGPFGKERERERCYQIVYTFCAVAAGSDIQLASRPEVGEGYGWGGLEKGSSLSKPLLSGSAYSTLAITS